MPHLTLEFSRNLSGFDPAAALAALNRAAVASGLFDEADIKSRAYVCDHFLVGLQTTGRAFVHVRAALLAGRSPAQRKALADLLLAALNATVGPKKGPKTQLSVETVEIDRASYAKEIVDGA
jgi:5-carboxymethyl-2-hydroxymuconate isomerase